MGTREELCQALSDEVWQQFASVSAQKTPSEGSPPDVKEKSTFAIFEEILCERSPSNPPRENVENRRPLQPLRTSSSLANVANGAGEAKSKTHTAIKDSRSTSQSLGARPLSSTRQAKENIGAREEVGSDVKKTRDVCESMGSRRRV